MNPALSLGQIGLPMQAMGGVNAGGQSLPVGQMLQQLSAMHTSPTPQGPRAAPMTGPGAMDQIGTLSALLRQFQAPNPGGSPGANGQVPGPSASSYGQGLNLGGWRPMMTGDSSTANTTAFGGPDGVDWQAYFNSRPDLQSDYAANQARWAGTGQYTETPEQYAKRHYAQGGAGGWPMPTLAGSGQSVATPPGSGAFGVPPPMASQPMAPNPIPSMSTGLGGQMPQQPQQPVDWTQLLSKIPGLSQNLQGLGAYGQMPGLAGMGARY